MKPTLRPTPIAHVPERRLLIAPAIVLPDSALGWAPQALGPGSVVEVVGVGESPIGLDEWRIAWVDNIGRSAAGWLGRTAQTTRAPRAAGPLVHVSFDGSTLSPVARLREIVAKEAPAEGRRTWTILSWSCIFGAQHRSLLQSVVRELGGRVAPDADDITVIRRMLRLMLNREVPMSEIAETKSHTAPKKAAAKSTKSSAKHAARKTISAEPSARSMSRTAGVSAKAALEKAGGAKALIALANRLSNDEKLSKKDLLTLRDGINATATEARDAKKGAAASQLSGANRVIRRLIRAL